MAQTEAQVAAAEESVLAHTTAVSHHIQAFDSPCTNTTTTATAATPI